MKIEEWGIGILDRRARRRDEDREVGNGGYNRDTRTRKRDKDKIEKWGMGILYRRARRRDGDRGWGY